MKLVLISTFLHQFFAHILHLYSVYFVVIFKIFYLFTFEIDFNEKNI